MNGVWRSDVLWCFLCFWLVCLFLTVQRQRGPYRTCVKFLMVLSSVEYCSLFLNYIWRDLCTISPIHVSKCSYLFRLLPSFWQDFFLFYLRYEHFFILFLWTAVRFFKSKIWHRTFTTPGDFPKFLLSLN